MKADGVTPWRRVVRSKATALKPTIQYIRVNPTYGKLSQNESVLKWWLLCDDFESSQVAYICVTELNYSDDSYDLVTQMSHYSIGASITRLTSERNAYQTE